MPRDSSRACAGSGAAKAPIRNAIVPTSTIALASPADAWIRKGATVFCQRTFHVASAFRGVRACSCEKATRMRRAISAGGRTGSTLASACCVWRHIPNSSAQALQDRKWLATDCIATPVTHPSRYAENCARIDLHELIGPPQLSRHGEQTNGWARKVGGWLLAYTAPDGSSGGSGHASAATSPCPDWH